MKTEHYRLFCSLSLLGDPLSGQRQGGRCDEIMTFPVGICSLLVADARVVGGTGLIRGV